MIDGDREERNGADGQDETRRSRAEVLLRANTVGSSCSSKLQEMHDLNYREIEAWADTLLDRATRLEIVPAVEYRAGLDSIPGVGAVLEALGAALDRIEAK